MINTLFVAWQQPDSREYIPVAKLEQLSDRYRFSYTQGVSRAKNFQPFDRMDNVKTIYESSTLFPLFKNRLINKSRPEFKNYLKWLGLSDSSDDPMTMLALTGGVRGTDSIELFQYPELLPNSEINIDFFARGLSHLPKEIIGVIDRLAINSKLFLMKDCQNPFDSHALALRSSDPSVLVGYCPKYYAQDLSPLLEMQEMELSTSVRCVNLDAPLSMRLLCRMSVSLGPNFVPGEVNNDFCQVINVV